jgi:hypothetical protein
MKLAIEQAPPNGGGQNSQGESMLRLGGKDTIVKRVEGVKMVN